tara:strand:+ start:26 stop:703 length:678 start_codon:yes stop_codon:yes gene_type:complete
MENIIILSLIILFFNSINKKGFIGGNNLTFESTQNWDNTFLMPAINISNAHLKFVESLNLQNHKENEYKKILEKDNVDKELEYMIELKKYRTTKKNQEIKEEIYLINIIKKFNLKDKNEINIMTKKILSINGILSYIKRYFNRVRPHFLHKDINPVIKNPGHPAYPSGHSIQAHLIAYLLPKEDLKKNLIIANKIAVNREIAGVHYRSDTKYGKYLAKKISEKLF